MSNIDRIDTIKALLGWGEVLIEESSYGFNPKQSSDRYLTTQSDQLRLGGDITSWECAGDFHNLSGFQSPYAYSKLTDSRLHLRYITENRRMKVDAAEYERRFRSIIECSREGIIFIDEDGRIIEWNTGAEEITGLGKDEALGRYAWDIQFGLICQRRTPEVYEYNKASIINILRGGLSPYLDRPFEWKIQRPDKTCLTVEEMLSCVPTQRGFKICSTLRDVTEIRRADETRLLLAAILDSVDEAVIGETLEGVITSWNAGAEKIYGYSAQEAVGKHISVLVPSNQANEIPQELERIRKGERVDRYETTRLRKDGRLIPVSIAISPIINGCGDIAGALAIVADIAERRRIEELVQASKGILRTGDDRAVLSPLLQDEIIDFLPDATFAIDGDGKVIAWNRALENLTGIRSEEMLGKGNYEYALPFYGQRRPLLIDLALKPGDVVEGSYLNIERRYGLLIGDTHQISLNGRKRYLRGVATIMHDSKGDIAGAIESIEDITEGKLAEDKIHKLSHIFENAAWGLAFCSPDGGRLEMVNPAYARMHGCSSEDLIGMPVSILCPPDEWESMTRHVQIAFQRGHHIFESNHIRKDGSIFPATNDVTMLKDEDGNILGCIVSVQDVSESKRAEEVLRETRDYLENLIDYANAPIIVWDISLKITRFNHAFERLVGRSAEEMLGEHLEVLFPEESRRTSLAYIQRTHLGERWEAVEIPILRADGSVRTVLWNSATIRSKDGGVVATIAQGQDITERKLAEERLIKAKEDAEAATRAKSEFLATMSHEIRTPMNAVIGMASILLDGDITLEQRDCLETIRSSGDALLAIINDILDLSKIERGGTQLKLQPFDLQECLKSSIDLLAANAAQKGLEMTCSTDGDVPSWLIGDVNRLRQVLVNLIGNAVKFTDKGKISISVKSRNLGDGMFEVQFSIKDTGIGISEESLGKLFLPFSQLDMSSTRRYGGTGLGLAISRRLVELMGGKIWVQSEPNQGSVFHFSVVARAETARGQICGIAQPKAGGQLNQDMRILLAEDIPVNQKTVLLMLKKLGYRADAVANGREVLEALEMQKYDLILMDVQMPVMDGTEATKEIRRRWPRGPKIIAITAYALEGDREKFIEAGMDDYIAKPVQKKDLEAILIRYSADLAKDPQAPA